MRNAQQPPSRYGSDVATALEGFLELECNDELASRLRAEIAAANGAGYDDFSGNLFGLELFYAEGRVVLADLESLGYEDCEVTLAAFLEALPDVPPGKRMPGRPRNPADAIPMPPAPQTPS
jgi:hypothetical protein